MASITIFRNLFSDQKETYSCSAGRRVCEEVSFDPERSHIFVNSFLKDKDYILCEDDVVLIREFPGDPLTGSAFILVGLFTYIWGAVIVDDFRSGRIKQGAQAIIEYLFPGEDNPSSLQDQEKLKKTPQIRGAKNQSWAGKPVPLIFGEHLFTPGFCGMAYTGIDPISDPDGEKQFITMLFMIGYAPLVCTDIRLGEILLASNAAKTLNGTISIDGRYSTAEYGTRLEIRDSAEVSLYPQKVVEDQVGIELLNVEGVGPEYPIRFSATNAQKVQVELMVNGLYSFNKDGNRENASIQVKAQWRPLNGTDAEWVDFPNFENTTPQALGFSLITRADKKQMRFISTKTFTKAEMDAIPSGIVEIRVFRGNPQSTDARVSDVVYWTASRTWCFDKEASVLAGSLVPQAPIASKLRQKTVRLGFRVYAKDDLQGVLDSVNMIVQAISRTWNGTTWSSKSSAYTNKSISRNPASAALTILQGNNLGKNAYNDAELDMAEFGRFYDFCNSKGFTCNGVITNDIKLETLLSNILFTGRAQKIMRDGLYSLYIDLPQSVPVTILNNQNVISAHNSKSFDSVPDGLRITFIDEFDRYQPNEIYVMDDGKSSTDPDMEFLDVELAFLTNRNHVWKLGRYLLACLILRPEVWIRKISIDGIGLPIGSLVSVQDDTIVVGLNSGGEIKSLLVSGPSIIGIESDSYFDMIDGSLYGVKILQANGIDDPTIRTIHVQTVPGTQNQLFFVNPIPTTDPILPSPGDIIAFGIRDQITTDAIVTGSVPSESGQYELSLIPYDPGVYSADSGTIPPFDSKITKPQGIPGFQEIPTEPVTIDDVVEILEPIVSGSAEFIPDNVSSVSAIARQDYIEITWAWNGNALRNAVKRYSIEISDDAGATWWTFYSTSTRFIYDFNRGIDRYPEKTTGPNPLNGWRVRIKAENIYNQISTGYGPSAAGQVLNLSSYLTWIPPAPSNIKAVAEEEGVQVSWEIDESSYYGTNKAFQVTIIDFEDIEQVVSGLVGRSAFIPYDRVKFGYPEKVANGGHLDAFTAHVMATTIEIPDNLGSSGNVLFDVSKYLTWIPGIPFVTGKSSGRGITLNFEQANAVYGFKGFHVQVRKTEDDPDWFAIGDSALAWSDETSYRSGAPDGVTLTPFSQLNQTVPLENQSVDLPLDTTYLYRARAVVQKGVDIEVSAYSPATTVIAKPSATIDIVAGAIKTAQLGAEAVTYEKIAARTVQADNLHALAANLVNTLVHEPVRTLADPDFPQGWGRGTFTGPALLRSTSRGTSLDLTPSANGQYITTDRFAVMQDEILEVSFNVYKYSAGTITVRGDVEGASTTGLVRYTWNNTTKKWDTSTASHVLLNECALGVYWLGFKTYICGTDVNIADVPAPAPSTLGNKAYCFKVATNITTAQLLFYFNSADSNRQVVICAPCVSSLAGGRIIANQLDVEKVSAISSKLGEITGDDVDNYKLVMGSGGSAEEGTLLLGAVTDESYLRRWKETGVWKMAMKLASFVVDAVSSKVIGLFQVRNSADNATAFQIDPSNNTGSLFGNNIEYWLRRGIGDFSSSNTGASDAGKYYKVMRITIYARYQDANVSSRITAVSHGSSGTYLSDLIIRVKQQDAFGSNPVLAMRQVHLAGEDAGAIRFGYVIVQNTPTTIVDIYCQITATYMSMKGYNILNTTPLSVELLNSQPALTIPSGYVECDRRFLQEKDLNNNLPVTGALRVGSPPAPASKIHSYENNASVGVEAGVTIEQAGTGDSLLQFLLTSVRRWVMGIDNSDSDKFKIAVSADLGTDTAMTIDTNKDVTFTGAISGQGFSGSNVSATESLEGPLISADTEKFLHKGTTEFQRSILTTPSVEKFVIKQKDASSSIETLCSELLSTYKSTADATGIDIISMEHPDNAISREVIVIPRVDNTILVVVVRDGSYVESTTEISSGLIDLINIELARTYLGNDSFYIFVIGGTGSKQFKYCKGTFDSNGDVSFVWTTVSSGISGIIKTLSVVPGPASAPDKFTIYIGTDQNLYVNTNGGLTSFTVKRAGSCVNLIAKGTHLYIYTSQHASAMYYSSDSGSSWNAFSQSFPGSVNPPLVSGVVKRNAEDITIDGLLVLSTTNGKILKNTTGARGTFTAISDSASNIASLGLSTGNDIMWLISTSGSTLGVRSYTVDTAVLDGYAQLTFTSLTSPRPMMKRSTKFLYVLDSSRNLHAITYKPVPAYSVRAWGTINLANTIPYIYASAGIKSVTRFDTGKVWIELENPAPHNRYVVLIGATTNVQALLFSVLEERENDATYGITNSKFMIVVSDHYGSLWNNPRMSFAVLY